MKQEHGSGSGTESVYRVEARSTFTAPQEINGMLLDNRWRTVSFAKAPIGVRNKVWAAEAHQHGFLSYEAALTLAHWFMANAEYGYCVETRLVKVKLAYSYSTEEVGVGEPMSHFHAERDAVFGQRRELPALLPPETPDA